MLEERLLLAAGLCHCSSELMLLAVRYHSTAADWTTMAVELSPDSHFPGPCKTDHEALRLRVRTSLLALSKSSKKPSTSGGASALRMDFEIFPWLNLGELATAQARAVRVDDEVGERLQEKLNRPPAHRREPPQCEELTQ
mmetsp:Transcript_50666/g.120953  ORF Transcript_50666/g.120953 Transcript_50666/m.120953 type:complete len:140 (-) Transcript_50666:25-444(-)